MKTTPNEAVPYPTDVDSAALPDKALSFLLNQDPRFPAWDAGFVLLSKGPAFSAHTTSNGPTLGTGSLSFLSWDVIDYSVGYNGASAGLSAGNSLWNQPNNDGPSWWVFGCSIVMQLVAGAINANNILQGTLEVKDKDPNSTSSPTLNFYNSGKSEVTDIGVATCLQIVTLAHFRSSNQGSVQVGVTYRDTGASVTKRWVAGSRFWGFRVGNG